MNPAAAVTAVTAGGYTTSGGIGAKWRSTGGAAKWGNPVSSEAAPPPPTAALQEFSKNGRKTTIYWSSATGAHVLENATLVGKKFISAGRERGYGYPSTDEMRISGGAYQVHRKGSAQTKVLWSPSTGAHAVKETGAIGKAWKRAGLERSWAGPPATSTPPTVWSTSASPTA